MTHLLWRIATEAPTYGADDLSGAGASISGGRWNSPGVRVVYGATSIALATLETVVHLAGPPFNRYLVRIELPGDLLAAAEHFQPDANVGWDAAPAGRTSIAAGDAWIHRASSLLLFVPSAIVPEESNVLINPLHPDVARISARKVRRFLYDPRIKDVPRARKSKTTSR